MAMHSKSPFFLFCGFVKKDDIKDKLQKINALGGTYENTKKFSDRCTHVICKQPVRNEIFLGACLTGKWILIPKYIHDCYEKQSWLQEDAYEWEHKYFTDYSLSHEKNFYDAPKRCRMYVERNGCKIFRGWKVALLIDDTSKSSRYTRLLELGNAEIINPLAKNAPDLTVEITHTIFEGLQFERLFSFVGRSIVLRPEYIDVCIMEISLPPTHLFEIFLPTETKERTFGMNNSFCCQENGANYNRTNDSVGIGMKAVDPICCNQQIDLDTEELQFCHSHSRSNQSPSPFTDSSTLNLSSVLLEHNDQFNSTDRELNSEDNAVSNGNLISDTLCRPMEPIFGEIDTDTYHHFDKDNENMDISLTSACSHGRNTDIKKNIKDIKFSRKHKNMKSSKASNSDGFYKTLKLVNEKARTTMQFGSSKIHQSKITSFFLDSYKEHVIKRKQCDDCDEWKISSTSSCSYKIPKPFNKLNTLSDNKNNCIKTSSQINTISDERNELDLTLVDSKQKTTKSERQKLKDKIDENNKEDYILPASTELTSLFDACLEENDPFEALDMAESLICTSYYPHPRMLNSLMFRILECSNDESITNRTFTLLHRIFHHHRPGNNNLGQYYLDAFSLCGKEVVSPWYMLSEIIRKCIQLKMSDNGNSKAAEHLLLFVTDVIEYNIKDFKFRNKYPRKLFLEKRGLLPIAAKIFWFADSKDPGTMSMQCKELFQYIYDLLACNIKQDYINL